MKDDYINAGRSQQKQKTRDRILNAAQKLLSEQSSFTLEDIARETELSRATIYRYFSSSEALSHEAALDLGTKSSEEVLASISGDDMSEMIHGIQAYYNKLALDNESTFRKYLSIVITQPPEGRQRGARRHHTLALALDQFDKVLAEDEKKNFMVVATALMGIEPLIVTKDVCQLSDKESNEVLSWGIKTLMKGLLAD